MVLKYNLFDQPLVLKSDLAAEFPIYLYWNENKSKLLFSKDLKSLLNVIREKKPLEISYEGISFLLQSGVIPPPKTIYKNLYILSVGCKAKIQTINNKIEVEFTFTYPFFNSKRLKNKGFIVDHNFILKMIAEATINRIDKSKQSFLFHSSGKDSNLIALAIAEAGLQDEFSLITYKSYGEKDESLISSKIAKKLGFKHLILNEEKIFKRTFFNEIDQFFHNSPMPCTDNAVLSYPSFSCQFPDLSQSNIVDGLGNDCYMGFLPTANEYKYFSLFNYTKNFHFIRSLINTESIIPFLIRTQSEFFDIDGFSFKDTKSIFKESINVFDYWNKESIKRNNWDLIDFKGSILTSVVSEKHIRKVRNFADVYDSNLILPFNNQKVANFFSMIPEKLMLERNPPKNKLILREILLNRINLDSDKLGKYGFAYDTHRFLTSNWNNVQNEILNCSLWRINRTNKLLKRFQVSMNKYNKYSNFIANCINRLYLISIWYNKNKYTN